MQGVDQSNSYTETQSALAPNTVAAHDSSFFRRVGALCGQSLAATEDSPHQS
jgi:hypothetical protein